MRNAAELPNVTSVAFIQKRSRRSDGNLTAPCDIHGPDIPENTGFSDYSIPFREVNQSNAGFEPVRTNSRSLRLFHSLPQPCPVTSDLASKVTGKQIITKR